MSWLPSFACLLLSFSCTTPTTISTDKMIEMIFSFNSIDLYGWFGSKSYKIYGLDQYNQQVARSYDYGPS